jgi:hypothetical protein
MEKELTDRSVQVVRSRFIDVPSLEAEYGKKRKIEFFFFRELGFFSGQAEAIKL